MESWLRFGTDLKMTGKLLVETLFAIFKRGGNIWTDGQRTYIRPWSRRDLKAVSSISIFPPKEYMLEKNTCVLARCVYIMTVPRVMAFVYRCDLGDVMSYVICNLLDLTMLDLPLCRGC